MGLFGQELEPRSVRLSNGMIQVRELEARRIPRDPLIEVSMEKYRGI